MESGLEGRRVLVTGGAGGIGTSVSRLLAAEGARPLVHYFRQRGAAEDLARELGGEAHGADLRREEEADRLFGACGRIDAVVVNAGVWNAEHVPFGEMTLAQWQATLEADLTTAFLTCRGFFRHLAAVPREEAAMVLVGSTAALFGEAGHGDYAAAKAAMAYGLARTLKNEIVALAPRGRVNCVCPGWVRTPMAEAALADPELVARATATMAMRKVAQPEDVARAVVYLLSPRLAGHVSGVLLPVHGGMEGRLLHPRSGSKASGEAPPIVRPGS